MPLPGQILQTQFETAGGAKTVHRRRLHAGQRAIGDLSKCLIRSPGHRLAGLLAIAKRPVLEGDMRQRRVGPDPGETETHDCQHLVRRRLRQGVLLPRLDCRVGTRSRGRRRQLDIGDDVSLILGRHECGGQPVIGKREHH
ncbi:hypothetical protein D3C76_1318730 [compost metagenome]